jgi:hypothetical protein
MPGQDPYKILKRIKSPTHFQPTALLGSINQHIFVLIFQQAAQSRRLGPEPRCQFKVPEDVTGRLLKTRGLTHKSHIWKTLILVNHPIFSWKVSSNPPCSADTKESVNKWKTQAIDMVLALLWGSTATVPKASPAHAQKGWSSLILVLEDWMKSYVHSASA